MPAAGKTEFVGGSPINSSVSQGGFSAERGGNLRDHNGCKASEAAIKATTHYDGDYGIGALQGALSPQGALAPLQGALSSPQGALASLQGASAGSTPKPTGPLPPTRLNR